MSKQYIGKLKTATIYLASAGEGIRDVYRETGADLVMTGHWWGSNGKPTGNYKVSGTLLSQEWTSSLGMGWKNGGVPTMGWSTMQDVDNFLCTVPLLYNGAKQDVSVAKYGASVCRPCARPAFGFRADGTFVALYEPRATLDQMQDKFLALGVVDALCLDGGGSGKWMDKDGAVEDSNRWLYNYVCFWFEGAGREEPTTKKKVCLDAGHGGNEVTNASPDKSYYEHEFTLDMAKRVKALLEPYVDVVMTRESNTTVSLAQRATIANSAKADVFVSLHSNASGSAWSNASGLCVYTYGAGATLARNILANKLLEQFSKVGIKLFGSKLYHSAFTVLANTVMPAVIIEYSFHTNTSDLANLKSNIWRQTAAEATARGVCDYLGIAYKETQDKPTDAQAAFNRLVAAGWGDVIISMAEKI